ncbi:MAG: diaminopropionate ammonia-lyase [Candidatus Electryonea clarkiae]|nr:diaminopropionate ammonia-lyase [Candidatus Electryonea clarkiae]MDP8286233.1 diaminopropionate ammonia-lyase [Candidatus Electryonea clarkiae]
MSRFHINTGVNYNIASNTPNREPLEYHMKLPGYSRTPLHHLNNLSNKLGLKSVLLKDESNRLTLPAFKILGASWAVYRLVNSILNNNLAPWKTVDELREQVNCLKPICLVTATDGNHGRGVACTAKWFGFEAKIFMPGGTVPARIAAIKNEGAEVIVIDGSYDDAVRIAGKHQNQEKGVYLVQDTSWLGYEEIPRWIIEGYSTLMWEIDDTLAEEKMPDPDLVIVPVGVGSLAAAAIAQYRNPERTENPFIIGVESVAADCALKSLANSKPTSVYGNNDTIMAGLNCGTLATIAWNSIRNGMDAVVAIEDKWAIEAMKELSSIGLSAGESGAASMAALLAIMKEPKLQPLKNALGVNSETKVLTFMTEGITNK